MTERAFIDTNVFIYAFEKGKTKKKKKAVKLIKNDKIHAITSVQVLNEFVSATVKKTLLSKREAVETALLIEKEFEVVPLNSPVFLKAMDIFNNDGIHASLWDSLIIAAAILSECHTVYTEDLQHNYVIENIKIKNPLL